MAPGEGASLVLQRDQPSTFQPETDCYSFPHHNKKRTA